MVAGSTSRVSDLIGLGWDEEFIFLRSYQVMLFCAADLWATFTEPLFWMKETEQKILLLMLSFFGMKFDFLKQN